jgi:NAD(P)H-hydrate repair Nnr-like enzyme with NAD(P)H-hydrate epimerase domain
MLWTSAQARTIDQLSTDGHGIPAIDLMEAAGLAVCHEALRLRTHSQKLLILAGPGHNGGDALVAARFLHRYGYGPRVLSVMDPQGRESPLRREQRLKAEAVGVRLEAVHSAWKTPDLGPQTLVIDGVSRAIFSRRWRASERRRSWPSISPRVLMLMSGMGRLPP